MKPKSDIASKILREGGKSPQVNTRKSKPIFSKREWIGLKYVLIGSLSVVGMVGIPEGIMHGDSWLSIITGWLLVSLGLTSFLAFVVYATNKTFEVNDDE